MKKFYRLSCWLALAGLLSMGSASAGGLHYKVNTSTSFYADEAGNLAGLRMNWVYDPEVSAFILDGRETSAEGLKQAAADILADLHELDYFAELSMDGAPVALTKASEYNAKLTAEKSLQLGFQLPLAAPVAVDGKAFGLTLSDPDATADMNYSGVERAVLAEALAGKCAKPELIAQPLVTDEHELTIHTVVFACP